MWINSVAYSSCISNSSFVIPGLLGTINRDLNSFSDVLTTLKAALEGTVKPLLFFLLVNYSFERGNSGDKLNEWSVNWTYEEFWETKDCALACAKNPVTLNKISSKTLLRSIMFIRFSVSSYIVNFKSIVLLSISFTGDFNLFDKENKKLQDNVLNAIIFDLSEVVIKFCRSCFSSNIKTECLGCY